ncbi:hypothetical protein, partial [Neobacillus vireti]|uniref:hypothetical protein n=1 Tax=Neobacillus vireti TaxID=220686 RepID=UPI002FFF73E7
MEQKNILQKQGVSSPIIGQRLEDDQKNWRKQKHTALKIFSRLHDEYYFKGSASNIRKIVANAGTNSGIIHSSELSTRQQCSTIFPNV